MTDGDDNAHANAANEQVRQAKANGTIPDSRPNHSMIRLLVDGEKLDADNPIDYLVMLLLEGKRYDGYWDGNETEVARWAVAQWCQELGWVPDLRDYQPGEQVERGAEIACLETAFYADPLPIQEHSDVEGLPTIAYETDSGERRRVRYERVDGRPWKVERHVDRPDGDGGWESCGGEPLSELVIDDEHRAAVAVTEGP